MDKIKIFYKNNNPIIAVPIGESIYISYKAIKCFPSFTLKRKVYKLYLYMMASLYYLLRYFPNEQKDYGILSVWYKNFSDKRVDSKFYPVFIWSTIEGRQRYYVHILDIDGNKIYFVKITSNSEDYKLLKNEYKALTELQGRERFTYTSPKVIDFIENNIYCSLSVESLHSNYKLFHPEFHDLPEKLLNEIRGNIEILNIEEVYDCSWYKLAVLDEYNLMREYTHSLKKDQTVKIAFAHGDFGGENIFQDNTGKFNVIDWERATKKAPIMLDHIAFWLGKNHKNFRHNEDDTVNDFYLYFANYEKLDIALALIFLNSVNFDLSFFILKNWNLFDQYKEKNENIF